MAQNLASKYEKQFAAAFSLASLLGGKTSEKFSWSGAKKIIVQSPVTVPLVDYERNGAARFGESLEMDTAIQEMELTQDKAFSRTLDRGNYEDSMMAVSAANWMSEQIKQEVTPFTEKYAFAQYVRDAGMVGTIDEAPTKNTVTEALLMGCQALDDRFVPDQGRYLYITSELARILALSPEFIGLERLGAKALERGQIGELGGAKVIKVPGSYLPENCYALMAHKESVLLPRKIGYYNAHNNPVGVNGWVMEGRAYFDAFVLAAKKNGVWALCLASKKQAAPTISYDSSLTITSEGAEKILYTIDGTDPRLNPTAKVYTSAVSGLPGGTYTVKAVAYGGADTPFTSDVAEKEITVA